MFANIYMPLTNRICTQQTLKLLTLEQANVCFFLGQEMQIQLEMKHGTGSDMRPFYSPPLLGLLTHLIYGLSINLIICMLSHVGNANANVPLQYGISHT